MTRGKQSVHTTLLPRDEVRFRALRLIKCDRFAPLVEVLELTLVVATRRYWYLVHDANCRGKELCR